MGLLYILVVTIVETTSPLKLHLKVKFTNLQCIIVPSMKRDRLIFIILQSQSIMVQMTIAPLKK